MPHLDELKSAIKERLPELDFVIGWGRGFDPIHATPLFMRTEADVDKLEWGPLNVHNTATYLPSLRGKKVGVVVKGCDSRSVVQLMQENLIDREDLVIFGMPCTGVVDLTKIKNAVGDLGMVRDVQISGDTITVTAGGKEHALALADVLNNKCTVCQYHNAVLSDVFVGEPIEPSVPEDQVYADILEFEEQTPAERMAFWESQMNRCIRCYACRNACPMCVCRDHCVAQSRDPNWLSQRHDVGEKMMFQLIHAMHLAGRCTECGECERACPVDIPLVRLKKKINKEIKELFDYQAGIDPEATPPLLAFKVEEQNIREREW
ncbi:4Fe-4S dicluster domain-containing protein [Oceanidesulfovibrio marinus]|uniref:4Fe-4S dicluster domain-containing protein n=1 Tax=Oceanidesulfovibrio marinus TaxID=370038 RepID=A0A6P1ZAH7_9BACT|nr:4Fe-4S dicluster domain-containing protein [Oceanidesulfovibrio marinus]QJT08714.1 4Fe-4S dicluster domain-containing protein [Oceanidesulfovibrio marinus]QJT09618.1 4Fe-4S dicluster domain-containing protein [Oceanidesulfovibrio marinus]TVM30065.1 4Fe-4S ferredoxin [Oceanidesulfovibrio marinus]